MSQVLVLLKEMRGHRVATYVGTASLTRLAAFLRGYEHAIYRLLPREADSFLSDFRDWIYGHFQTTDNISWEGVILRHSAGEVEAVDRFWELLDEYLQEGPAGSGPAPVAPVTEAAANGPRGRQSNS